MAQIHKRYTTEQTKVLLEAYQQRHLSRDEKKSDTTEFRFRIFFIFQW